MSDIRVKDLSARAALRLGRTYQVNALAPFPARPPLNLWQPWRRAWMHPAADLGAGFGFGADSNLLRRLKNGIAAEGLDPAGLDTLTNADVTTDRRGVAVRPAAAARLAAATREANTKAERPPKLQNWFFEKRPAQRIARKLASAETGEYEDAGGGEAIDIAIHLPEGAAARSSRSKYIAAPIRLTHVHVAFGFDQTMPGLLRWSVKIGRAHV